MAEKLIDFGNPEAGQSRFGLLNHLRFTVKDIAEAEHFYGPLMGFMGYELAEKGEDRLAWVRFSTSVVFWFILSTSRQPTALQKELLGGSGFHHLAWNAESRNQVDELHRLLVDTGAKILDAPAEYDYEPGYYAVFFADPDGRKLEFVHLPIRPPSWYKARFCC